MVALFAHGGVSFPFWLAVAVLVAVQSIIGIYGHHLIQKVASYSGILQGIFFVVMGVCAMHKAPEVFSSGTDNSVKNVLSGVVLVAAYNLSWVFCASDYTRYISDRVPARSVFLSVFSGQFLPTFVLGIFGYLTASVVAEQTPNGIVQALSGLAGPMAPLVLAFLAFDSTPSNAVNDNSAAYSLISSGFKIARPTAAVFGGLLGFVVCLVASDSFIDSFEALMVLFAHLMMPWAAVLLVHWLAVQKTERRTASGLAIGFWVFLGVPFLSIGLFAVSPFYTGVLSDKIGGVDAGPYLGFALAGFLYYVLYKLIPHRFKVKRKPEPDGSSRRRERLSSNVIFP